MSLHDEFGYEIDASLKKIKGKVAKPLKVKMMKKTTAPTVRLKKVKAKKKAVDKGYNKIRRTESNEQPQQQGSTN